MPRFSPARTARRPCPKRPQTSRGIARPSRKSVTGTFGFLLARARCSTCCLFWCAASATSFERPNTVTSVASEWYLHRDLWSTCAVTAAGGNSRDNASNALRHSMTGQNVAGYASTGCYSCGAGQSGDGLTCSTREHGWTEMISRQNQ